MNILPGCGENWAGRVWPLVSRSGCISYQVVGRAEQVEYGHWWVGQVVGQTAAAVVNPLIIANRSPPAQP